jgi:membrane protease YdiL (CAAX protease family)
LVYLPVVVFALASLAWLKGETRLKESLTWTRFSLTFPVGCLVSAAYALYLFLTHDFGLKGVAFVPPALFLAGLNSLSEEILYRVVLLNLLVQWSGSFNRSNLIQALVYGSVHLVIGGPAFFIVAAAYGYLLGLITRTNESVLPALICHAVADIGAVALPLLIIVS